MKVSFLTSSFHTEPVGIHAKFHDIVQYLRVMENPPFEWELITCNFNDHVGETYPVRHANGQSKRKQIQRFVRYVRRASSDTDVFHLNQTDLRLGAPTALAAKGDVPLVAGPNVSAYHPAVLDDVLPLLSKKRWMMNLRISKSYRNRLLYHRYSPISRRFDTYLAFTTHHGHKLVESGLDPEKIETLPSGTRPDVFFPDGNREPNPEREFLFVGRPTEWKGFDLFIEALAGLREERRDFTARVVGSADSEAKAAAVSRGLDDVVKFEGRVPRGDLPKYYRAADVLVNPSRYETEGMTSVEARACGTPVIGSDIPAFDGKNTLTFASGDADALYERLSEFFDARERYRKSALSTVDDWSIVHSIDHLSDIYGSLCSGNST